MAKKAALERIRNQLARVQGELKPLSRLIKAMFNDIDTNTRSISMYYAAKFDRTEPRKEQILNKKRTDMEIEGDFYLINATSDGYVYIVFGDATGHFAYAGGLKLFIATALQRIFDRNIGISKKTSTAAHVVRALSDEFQRVGEAALRDNRRKPLEDGANLIVVRVHPGARRVDYASAGVSVTAIAEDGGVKPYGGMFDRPKKSLRFPTSLRHRRELKPIIGSFGTERIAFLAFVTDGFENLGRSTSKDPRHPVKKLGRDAVNRALRRPFKRKKQPVKADGLVESVVRCARNWRRDHFVPEDADDDRLVLAFDIRGFRAQGVGSGRVRRKAAQPTRWPRESVHTASRARQASRIKI
jgi:hypothetical protein